ncbi:DUF4269 domain-containing protein [Sphingobium lactosutens]|uniref:DUF4269 domain-containing protein n=1 Tax=Sphingobium lactosutens TaxID=522773 RepID=UPI0015C1AF24|nr:DUF4269 domain-containing protein [Sphingobium lactosutens]
MTRPDYRDALARSGVMEVLAPFSPHLVGTPPLGIAMPDSDLDIVCEVRDGDAFIRTLTDNFSAMAGFALRRHDELDAIICGFVAHGWAFEIFGQPIPVTRQHGWRHYEVERRLLTLGGGILRHEINILRNQGLKTEPAFGRLLGLNGDPYAALLELERQDDDALRELIHRQRKRRAEILPPPDPRINPE